MEAICVSKPYFSTGIQTTRRLFLRIRRGSGRVRAREAKPAELVTRNRCNALASRLPDSPRARKETGASRLPFAPTIGGFSRPEAIPILRSDRRPLAGSTALVEEEKP